MDIEQEARDRLFPSLSDPSYLVLRSRRLIFSQWAQRFGGRRLTILDVGGRYQPYRTLFPNLKRYIAIDLIRTPAVSVIADGERLPFLSESFDLVIATQTVEYFRDPGAALQQIHAILKPDGVFLGSFAACVPRFVEHERWRFTPNGLLTILKPFAKVEIIPELHSPASVLRTINLALNSFVRYDAIRSVYQWSLCPLLNLAGLGIEKLNLTSNDQFTANYSVFATKQ